MKLNWQVNLEANGHICMHTINVIYIINIRMIQIVILNDKFLLISENKNNINENKFSNFDLSKNIQFSTWYYTIFGLLNDNMINDCTYNLISYLSSCQTTQNLEKNYIKHIFCYLLSSGKLLSASDLMICLEIALHLVSI